MQGDYNKSDNSGIEPELCSDVMLIKLFPGIDNKIFEFIKGHYKGVVIESFGIGGIPNIDNNIVEEIHKLIEAGVAVVVTTQCNYEGVDLDIYEVGKKLAKENVIIAADMTTEAVVMKLMWALAHFGKNAVTDIKKYIEDNPGTSKNKYSGMFENKNFIFVVAESYSEIGVDEERTPTLYRLIHNGFIFNNFYVPYYLSTIGGEAQSLTGLYPNYATLTKWKSGENSFPYGLATVFKDKGYNTYAYHAHNGYFQNRYKYLKSLGFDNFKACNMGLDINCDIWPESDIEMINTSINDYIDSDKPFMTYYMTVSGHLDYDKESNSIVSKNWDMVKDLDYSDKAKAYLATQIELDRAMESLIKKLDDKGILKDTVIVMLADHYPYGLSLEEINELSSYKRDELFEINHNSLVIYNSAMKNVNISKTGMPIDVLPTIYNLSLIHISEPTRP